MPIFGQNNVNSVKTTLYCGLKKAIWYPFFSDFWRKNNCSHANILSEDVHFLKQLPLYPYFVWKSSILSKALCSRVIFSNFSSKTSCCHAQIWSKNINSVKTTIKKLNGMPFFPILYKKITTPMPIFCHKKLLSSKNTLLFCLYFVKNMSIL